MDGEPNPDGRPTQEQRFKQTVHEEAKRLRQEKPKKQDKKGKGKKGKDGEGEGEQESPEEKEAKKQKQAEQDAMNWLKRLQTVIRPLVREHGFAEASMRMAIDAAKLFVAMGRDPLAFKAIEHAASLNWPDDAKNTLNI